MSESSLHDDILQMRDTLTELVRVQGETTASVAALDKRLFNGSGDIPELFRKYGESETRLQAIENSTGKQHAYSAGFGAGAMFVATLAAKWLAGKMGIHI